MTFTISTTVNQQGAAYGAAPFVPLPPPSFPSIQYTQPGPIPIPNVVSNLLPEITEQKPPGTGLVTGTVKAFLKDEGVEIPGAAKAAGVVVSAGIAGKKLADNIDKALEEGQPPAEAYLCQAAKTITEELSGKIMKGAVVGGIPAYFAAAASSPPLAATVPIVVQMIPAAYQGAQTTAKVAGATAETICHQSFDFARQLTNKGN